LRKNVGNDEKMLVTLPKENIDEKNVGKLPKNVDKKKC
jgi:hypothetical protein